MSDHLYITLRPIVEYATRCHYASVTIRGRQNLPHDGGYIIAPCHQNAMMEPLLILLLTHKPIYHICRGDIFAKPAVARILAFLKIFPIFRRRDGMATLQRNAATFEESKRVLLEGFPLSMMAEGQHTNRHQLLPLVKGMFRIAGDTQASLGDKPLYIVPLGIDLDDYERPFSHAVLNIGEPIDVRPFMSTFTTDEPTALNQMRQALTTSLKAAMHNIDSHQYYEEFDALCNLLNPEERKQYQLSNSPYNRFLMRQQIALRLDNLEKQNETPISEQSDNSDETKYSDKLSNPSNLNSLIAFAREKIEWCQKHHRRLKTIAEPLPPLYRAARLLITISAIAAIATFRPLLDAFLFAILAYPLPLLPTHLIVRRIISDPQFRSSINFGIRFVIALLYIPIFTIVIGILHGPITALAAFVAAIIMARISAPVIDWLRRTISF